MLVWQIKHQKRIWSKKQHSVHFDLKQTLFIGVCGGFSPKMSMKFKFNCYACGGTQYHHLVHWPAPADAMLARQGATLDRVRRRDGFICPRQLERPLPPSKGTKLFTVCPIFFVSFSSTFHWSFQTKRHFVTMMTRTLIYKCTTGQDGRSCGCGDGRKGNIQARDGTSPFL